MDKPLEVELYRQSLWSNSPKTQIQRVKQYNLLRKYLDKDLEEWTVEDALGFLATQRTVNTQYSYIAVFLHFHEEWRTDLQPYIDELVKARTDCAIQRNKEQLEWLPRKHKLLEHANELYRTGQWKKFIISYLMTNTYCRSQDVCAWIKDDHQMLGYENYLVRHPTHVEFIRNQYKTVKTYGPKRCSIHDPRFRHAVQQLPANDRVAHHHVDVIAATYKRIGEGSYFKVLVLDTCERGEKVLNNLSFMSRSRGTNFETMCLNYNLQI